jgi:hypothetical protein
MSNKVHKYSNETRSYNPQCKVVVYQWQQPLNKQDITEDKLSRTTRLDISSQVQSVTFNKNMGSAAGSFSIQLTNSPNFGSNDWKDIIKRGYWVLIYMTQDGDLNINPEVGAPISKNKSQEAKRIRCIGYVERVAVTGTTLENRAIDVGFQVTGRDFGIVYEETNIWHNMFYFDKMMLDGMKLTKMNITGNVRVHDAVSIIHDLFYQPSKIPGAKVNDNQSLLSIGLQWLLPRELVSDLGYNTSSLVKGTYWGALPGILNVSKTTAGIAISNPGDYLTGNAWSQLKRLSIPQFHELFCETQASGKPQLTFRPIPWAIDKSKYPNAASTIKYFKDLTPVTTTEAVDLYEFSLGEDDHSRYNSFLATVSTTLISTDSNVLLKESGFPKNNLVSIKRHGFRPMHVTVDSIVKNEELGKGKSDLQKLKEFNEILFDYWNNAVYAESGSIQRAGSNDVKIGTIMKFKDDVPYLSTKRYYIEGYTDTFTVGEKRDRSWVQEVNLTRGFEEADLKSRTGFSIRNTEFTGVGEYTKGEGDGK